jgi:hypothetical protein
MAEQVPNVIGSLQNKLNNQSFNPGEYSNEQLQVIDGLLEQGVLKGPRMGEIVKTFSETQRTIAKEKEFAKDPLAVALEGKSVFKGDVTGLIPTRPGAEFVGDITGSLIPYIRNKDLLVNSLSKPNSAQGTLFTKGALELADYIEKIPGLGKKLKFTRSVLGSVGRATDAVVSGRYQQLAKTEIQSLAGGVLGAGAGVQAYDLVNKSVGKDLAIAIQSDLAELKPQEVESDTTLATLEAMKNSLYWGLAGTAMLPVLGMAGRGVKNLFGVKGPKALELAQYAQEKGLPIPLIAGMDKGPFSFFGKTFFKTVGVFPFVSKIGDQALREAEEKVGKAFLEDLMVGAPIMKTSALSVASLAQFKNNFEKHANLISANYTALFNKAEDVGNPAVIKLNKTKEVTTDFINEHKKLLPNIDGLGGNYAPVRKGVFELSEQVDPLYQLIDAIQGTSLKPFTFKEYAGLQRLLTKSIQQTKYFDVRKSLFSLREALENDLTESFGKLNKTSLLDDASVKTSYDATLRTSGQQAADAYLDKVLLDAQSLNAGLKEANTIFSKTLAFYDKSVARSLAQGFDKTLFTNKQLNGITGIEAISPTRLFDVIEKNVFKSGDTDAVEQLKVLYGYNTSKEGKQMFDRAFNRYMYNAFISSFGAKSFTPNGVFEFVENAITKSPKSTDATDVIRKLGQEDFAAARGFTVKDALDNKGNEVIDITFGKDDFAEFSANKFIQNLGQFGNPKTVQESRRMLATAYGGGKQGAEALNNLERFIKYTKALEDVPISETSSFLQRRLTLGGSSAILGGFVLGGGGLATGNIFAPLVFLYLSTRAGKILSDPTSLRYMMDVLSPEERVARAAGEVGTKKVLGVPVTTGETRARAFARFANYLADEEQDLPKVDPKNIKPEEIIQRLQNTPTRVPKQGFKYSDLPKSEKERMFPEMEVRNYAPPAYNLEADTFRNSYVQGNTRALTALNQDYGVGAPAATAVAEEEQAQQTAGNALQPPRIQPLTTPQAAQQPEAREQQVKNLFPFDTLSQQIARQG